jgi:hypothetical protein
MEKTDEDGMLIGLIGFSASTPVDEEMSRNGR